MAAFLAITSASNASRFPVSVMFILYFLRPFAQNVHRFGKIFDLEDSFSCLLLFKGNFHLVLTVDVNGTVFCSIHSFLTLSLRD